MDFFHFNVLATIKPIKQIDAKMIEMNIPQMK